LPWLGGDKFLASPWDWQLDEIPDEIPVFNVVLAAATHDKVIKAACTFVGWDPEPWIRWSAPRLSELLAMSDAQDDERAADSA
jgi:hypothetical protein